MIALHSFSSASYDPEETIFLQAPKLGLVPLRRFLKGRWKSKGLKILALKNGNISTDFPRPGAEYPPPHSYSLKINDWKNGSDKVASRQAPKLGIVTLMRNQMPVV